MSFYRSDRVSETTASVIPTAEELWEEREREIEESRLEGSYMEEEVWEAYQDWLLS